MVKQWRTNDIIGTEDAQRWEEKADKQHRHQVSDIDGLAEKIDEVTRNKANNSDISAHVNNRSNPHNVTKAQIGLSNVLDVEQASKTDLNNHTRNTNNPHNVTKAQVGLSNVDNVKQATYTDHEATKRELNEQEQRLALLEEMVLQNKYYVPLKAEDNTNTFLVDEHNNLVVADWQYDVKER